MLTVNAIKNSYDKLTVRMQLLIEAIKKSYDNLDTESNLSFPRVH